MSTEEKLDKFIEEYRNDREDDIRRQRKAAHLNLSLLSLGFTLTIAGLSLSATDWTSRIFYYAATFFFVMFGVIEYKRSMNTKK